MSDGLNSLIDIQKKRHVNLDLVNEIAQKAENGGLVTQVTPH